MRQEDEARARILEAARDVFREYGPSHATIRDVASRAGVSSALVYYYFKDKEELFREVVVQMDSEFLASLRMVLDSIQDPGQRLRTYFIERFKRLNEAAARRRLSMERTIEYLPVFHSAHETFVEGEARLIAEIIEFGRKKGRFFVQDVQGWSLQIARVILAMDHLTFMQGRSVVDSFEAWGEVVDTLIRGLECGNFSQVQLD